MNLEDFERVCMILDNTLIHAILYTFLSPFAYIISFDVNYWWWAVGGGVRKGFHLRGRQVQRFECSPGGDESL